MKRRIIGVVVLLALTGAAAAWWVLYSPATSFSSSKKYLHIPSKGANETIVMELIRKDSILRRPGVFKQLADWKKYFNNIKPGRYKVDRGTSHIDLLRMLIRGNQTPVKVVIGKTRTPEEFAKRLSRYIESDSAAIANYMLNNDSLETLGTNGNLWMSFILPDTYEIIWTQAPGAILKRLKDESTKWWAQNGRLDKAKALALSPQQVYIVASIVEEETNKKEDKALVASVYLNRLRLGMPLQADPTVRFARKDFATNRVLKSHLQFSSPYNTYQNRGLPPGPICTASPETIDAVLNAPQTNYLYFVAKADFSGYSVFNESYEGHIKAAREYQDSLTEWLKRKAKKEKTQPAP